MKFSPIAILVIAAGAIMITENAIAHAPDQSNLFLIIEDDAVRGRVEITLKDLNDELGLSLPTDKSVTLEDIRPHIRQIQEYVTERVRLTIGPTSGPPPFTDYDILHVSFASFLQLHFAYEDLPQEPRKIDITYKVLFDTHPNQRGMLVIETNWKTGTFENESNVSAIFEPGRERQTLDLSSSSTLNGFVAMVGLGTHHIWIGIDHILFLFALLLPAVVYREKSTWEPVEGFRPALIHVVKVVTIFTVAHTITLSLAAFNAISLSSRLVESIIAISISIAALHIFVPIFRSRIWLIVFVFGLFHGFGFASVLGEIGIPPNYMVHSLLGFNIGVELGQIAIVLAIFPILFLLRQLTIYTTFLLPAAAAGLIVVSLYWFTERAFVIDLPAGAIVNSLFGLSA